MKMGNGKLGRLTKIMFNDICMWTCHTETQLLVAKFSYQFLKK